MQLFFAEDIESGFCALGEEESNHCVRVEDYGRHSFYLHLAVAPTKNTARMEWLFEKAVELGVDEITPLRCDHSERCVLRRERMEKIIVSAMKQSLKCYMPRLNEMTRMSDLLRQIGGDVDGASVRGVGRISLARPDIEGQRFIAHCDDTHRTPVGEAFIPGSNVLILIGPEGDFSTEEIALALGVGFQPVMLGRYRLRTETAAMAATALFNLLS